MCVALLTAGACLQAEAAKATLVLTSPVSCQVFQRGKSDQTDILIEGIISDQVDVIEAKAVVLVVPENPDQALRTELLDVLIPVEE